MSGRKGMQHYSEELKNKFDRRYQRERVRMRSAANMGLVVIRFRVGAA